MLLQSTPGVIFKYLKIISHKNSCKKKNKLVKLTLLDTEIILSVVLALWDLDIYL